MLNRPQSYIAHPLRALLAQRIYRIASGYADGNDANSLRHDSMLKLGVEWHPLGPAQDLTSASICSRLEHQVDRKDLYRLMTALGDHFIVSYPEPPAALVLDLDHSNDPIHIFEGTSHALVTAYLRPARVHAPPGQKMP